jgi:hypothetical protein
VLRLDALNCEAKGEIVLKSLVVGVLLVFVCLGSSPDVAVYPGAVVDEQVSKSIRKSNPANVAYNTADVFEKVDDYYKKLGSQDVPHSRNTTADMKYVVLRFPEKKFQVQLSYVAADKKHGTVIQFVQRP